MIFSLFLQDVRGDMILDQQLKERILKSITSAIDLKFGDGVTQVLLWSFQRDAKSGPLDIPLKPEGFQKCIRQVFGPGSKSIEDAVTREICSEFKINHTEAMDIAQAIQLIRAKAFRDELMDS